MDKIAFRRSSLYRHTIRLTFLSPSSLTAHLPQATLKISSIPQLCQLLTDEVERCLLYRICERGRETHEHVGGTWFVDLSRCVGRWEGCVLYAALEFPCFSPLTCFCQGISIYPLGRTSPLIVLPFNCTGKHRNRASLFDILPILLQKHCFRGLST